MKPAPSGMYFAKYRNYKRVVVLAYKIDLKIRTLLLELLCSLSDHNKKKLLQKRIDLLSHGFRRLKILCPFELDCLH